jgi:ring-1,2-phenylacetyl-CoA epoxidase subunit PaaC
VKEVTYHRRWSSEWVIRLGDGTPESHEKAQAAVDRLWEYSGELFVPAEFESESHRDFQTPDVATLRHAWKTHLQETLDRATLQMPADTVWMQGGGKTGKHSEHLGYILTELQYMQRAYPAMQW